MAVLNIGGVANITWIGRDGGMLAFDTGPGNALLDDWCRRHTGLPMDRDGQLAAGAGSIKEYWSGFSTIPISPLRRPSHWTGLVFLPLCWKVSRPPTAQPP